MCAVLVLCYHAISAEWSTGLAVKPDAFERQISNLVRKGWSPATLTEAVRERPARNTVVVTFDDAFASVKRYAQPVLGQLGVRATVFAPTDYVSKQAPLAWTGLDHWAGSPHAGELTPMSWDDLGELAELGWEIGSHTRTHPRLTSLSDQALASELSGSREECAERMGRPITSIAYPYGDLDDRVVVQTERAGYAVAATMAWPSEPLHRLRYPRIGVYQRDSTPRFWLKTARWSRSAYASKLITRRTTHVQRS